MNLPKVVIEKTIIRSGRVWVRLSNGTKLLLMQEDPCLINFKAVDLNGLTIEQALIKYGKNG